MKEEITSIYDKSVELSIKYQVLSEMTAFLLIVEDEDGEDSENGEDGEDGEANEVFIKLLIL